VIPTLPLVVRNRLAETILAACHDAAARRTLACLAESGDVDSWLGPEERRHASALLARARRATVALAARPPSSPEAGLAEALETAAILFDAGLHFEVHELLEPWWARAEGEARDALQGFIQVAIGYQHLANGNLAGARALLGEGSARLARSAVGGLDTRAFAAAVTASVARLPAVTEAEVPRFPRSTVASG